MLCTSPVVITNDFIRNYRYPVNQLILRIAKEDKYIKHIASTGVKLSNWLPYLTSFRRKLIMDPETVLGSERFANLCSLLDKTAFLSTAPSDEKELKSHNQIAANFLFDIIVEKAVVDFEESIASYKALCNTSDLRAPDEWYPLARLIKRKVFYHGGPTNSGKTYQALQRLKAANPEKGGGLYCGPLRLLALEVYENLNRSGVYCSLITGQVFIVISL